MIALSLLRAILLRFSMFVLSEGAHTRTGFLAPPRFGYSIAANSDEKDSDLNTNPDMNPDQFLLISSPKLGKIVWTKLNNFASSKGRSFALVSTGLKRPKGIAVHKKTGLLYIADPGARAIYRYQLVVDGAKAQVATTGERISILEGYPVEWVAVDDDGNLYFTSLDKNTINKIDIKVIHKLATQEFKVESLRFVPEKTLEAEVAARSALIAASNSSEPPVDEPEVQPVVLSLYDAEATSHVSSPEAVWVDGTDLYWSNTQAGTTAGTIVKGRINPEKHASSTHSSNNSSINSTAGKIAFPVWSVTNKSMNAFGFARVGNKMFFSHCQTAVKTCVVKGLLMSTGDTLNVVAQLTGPRALAWDGDETIYVADEEGGNVWSFPTGRFMQNAPLQKTVSMQGAFGLVIVSDADPVFANKMFDGSAMEAASQHKKSIGFVSSSLTQNSNAVGSRGHAMILLTVVMVACFHATLA